MVGRYVSVGGYVWRLVSSDADRFGRRPSVPRITMRSRSFRSGRQPVPFRSIIRSGPRRSIPRITMWFPTMIREVGDDTPPQVGQVRSREVGDDAAPQVPVRRTLARSHSRGNEWGGERLISGCRTREGGGALVGDVWGQGRWFIRKGGTKRGEGRRRLRR